MSTLTLTSGNDVLQSDTTLFGTLNSSTSVDLTFYNIIDAGAGFDTFVYYDNYFDNSNDNFKLTTPVTGGVMLVATVSGASGGANKTATLTLKNFEKIQFVNTNISLAPTIGDDLLNGGKGNDTFHALDGNDKVIGNAGNDVLDGGAGTDTLIGGAGNDTYVIDTRADVITEKAGGGTDLVEVDIATVGGTYTLGATLEMATVVSNVAYNLTGNAGANTLVGNAAANVLNGGAGIDHLTGGAGSDTYLIDQLADVITELASGGQDLVKVGVATTGGTYTLGANLENATLTNKVAFNLTGNGLDNTLEGNALANGLKGAAGNDVLSGGLGADSLTGGAGADSFRFDALPSSKNVDTVTDFAHGLDHLLFDDAFFLGLGEAGSTQGTAIGVGEFAAGTAATTADQRFSYDDTTGKLFYDKNGNVNGAADQVQVAVFGSATHPILDASDFLIV